MTEFKRPTGVNFRIEPEVSLKVLSGILCSTLSFLQEADATVDLARYEDWWQHDGLHFRKGRLGFHDAFAMVATPRAVLESMADEFNVFIGLAPESGGWYLRFIAEWDADDTELVGRLDITLPANMTTRFRADVVAAFPNVFVEEEATGYFARIVGPA